MLKKISSIYLLPVLGLLALNVLSVVTASESKAQEASSCNVAMVSGEYGFQDAGTRKVDGATVSYDAVRTASFDGKGNQVGKGFVSIDGKIVGYTVTAKYAITQDCTFTMDATQAYADGRPNQPYKQFGVVVRGGKEILELQTTGGKNQAGKYQRISNY